MGIVVDSSHLFTITDVEVAVTTRRGATLDGSWGVWLKNGGDVLLTNFNISAVNYFDIAVQVCGFVRGRVSWAATRLFNYQQRVWRCKRRGSERLRAAGRQWALSSFEEGR